MDCENAVEGRRAGDSADIDGLRRGEPRPGRLESDLAVAQAIRAAWKRRLTAEPLSQLVSTAEGPAARAQIEIKNRDPKVFKNFREFRNFQNFGGLWLRGDSRLQGNAQCLSLAGCFRLRSHLGGYLDLQSTSTLGHVVSLALPLSGALGRGP